MNKSVILYFARDVIKLTRAWNLIIVIFTQAWTIYFLIPGPTEHSIQLNLDVIFLIIGTTFIAAAGYANNDYYDVKIDFVNKPEKVVVGKYIKRRYVMLLHGLFSIVGIFLGLLVSVEIAVVNILAALLLWLYSNRLKRLPLIGNITVSLLAGMTVLTVGIYYSVYSSPIILFSVFAFFYTLIREIIKDIQDMKGDEIFGCKTLPILIGIRKTKLVIYGFSILFIATCPLYLDIFQSPVRLVFFTLLVVVQGTLLYLLYLADTKYHFSRLSSYCKGVMLGGILSMMIFTPTL